MVPDDAQPERVVLLVDDDALLLRSLSRGLLPLPARVQLAASGEEALAWLEAGGVPAAVICDLRMGAADGHQVLQQVRLRAPGCWCALHTGERVPPDDLPPHVVLLRKPLPLADLRRLLLSGLESVTVAS